MSGDRMKDRGVALAAAAFVGGLLLLAVAGRSTPGLPRLLRAVSAEVEAVRVPSPVGALLEGLRDTLKGS